MRIALVGGTADGTSYDVSEPLSPILRIPVATDDVPLSWSGEVSVADLTLPAFTVAEYRLAYTVLDRRP